MYILYVQYTTKISIYSSSYVFHLKNFIDENIASGSNAQMTWTIWYLQQFSMVGLYHFYLTKLIDE